jgi:hypothetical protein
MNTSSFDWNGATITVMAPNGFSRLHHWRLIGAVQKQEIDNPLVERELRTITYYLALTTEVKGDLGFPVPLDGATGEQVVEFVLGVGTADDELVMRYENAILEAQAASNDPDLLPSEAMEKKASKAPKSKAKDAASA